MHAVANTSNCLTYRTSGILSSADVILHSRHILWSATAGRPRTFSATWSAGRNISMRQRLLTHKGKIEANVKNVLILMHLGRSQATSSSSNACARISYSTTRVGANGVFEHTDSS